MNKAQLDYSIGRVAQLEARIADLEKQDEVHWKTRRSLLICIEELHETLEGLYRDNIDYLTINNLGGYDNHWLVMARKVLKLPCSTSDAAGDAK